MSGPRMVDHHVQWRQCPWCLALHDAALNVRNGNPPADGARCVCSECAAISVFDAEVEGGLRRPNPAEELADATNTHLQQLVAAQTLVLHEREFRG